MTRQTRYTLCTAVPTVLLLILCFFPFVSVRLDGWRYTFALWQAVGGYMTVGGFAIGLPAAVRILVCLLPLFSLLGLWLLWRRRALPAALCFVGAALCLPASMLCMNFLVPALEALGAVRIAFAYHWTLFAGLLLGLFAALLCLLSSGAETFARALFLVCACVSVGAVVLITVYLIAAGTPAIAEIGLSDFLFGTVWNPTGGQYGIWYMILASLAGTLGAVAIGVPVGLLTAVFLAELAPPRLARVVRPAVELLAGIPSVVYGFFGLLVIVPAIRRVFPQSFGDSLLAVILLLAIMVLPTIVSVSETALRAVPPSYAEASLALGNTRVGTIFGVVLPAAKSGVLSGVLLGVGRAIGETMAVVMVAGNLVQAPGLLRSVRPLTGGVVLEMSYSAGLHRQALFSIGLVLFVFILLVNLTFTAVVRKGGKTHG